MYLIVTKTFPTEFGVMQNILWVLSNEQSKHHMIKVFADFYENHNFFDEEVSF
jgi:phosphatidylinositol alpha-1,6-mannosyltransferase